MSLHGIFARQAQLTPDRSAVEDGSEVLTYAELDRRATALAAALGSEAGPVIGVAARRSVNSVVAVLGVLKAGAAYLPLDPTYPPARLSAMLEQSRARVLVSTTDVDGVFNVPPGVRVVDVGGPLPDAGGSLRPAGPDDLAYVIYTSGSTGTPRGVAMPHRGPVNLVGWQRRHSARPPGRTLHFSSLSFDVAVQELFDTWAGGGTLVVVDDETRRDPERLCAVLHARAVERLFLPYVALQSLAIGLEHEPPPPTLREVITAGEQLVLTPAIRSLFQRMPGCVLENQYGPTETHVATAFQLGGDPRSWPDLPPIGRPIDGMTAMVLDDERREVPAGTPGELFLAGVGVAQGYLHRPDLTTERFGSAPGGGVRYRTGDLVVLREDGLHFLGRTDQQVKVRGYRVEPGEVEASFSTHDRVREAAVVTRPDGTGASVLVAYVAADTGVGASVLRDHVAALLPEYMVPDFVELTDRLPRTPSGKVDRGALPDPMRISAGPGESPRTPTEGSLAAMVAELLSAASIGVTQPLAELGADSILRVRLRARIRTGYRVQLPLAAVFAAGTVRKLAAAIDAAPEVVVGGLSTGAPDASSVPSEQQRQFWLLNRVAAGRPAYNEGLVATVDGPVSVADFTSAVRALAERHPVLRSVFTLGGGSLTVQAQPAEAVPIVVRDLAGGRLPDAVRSALLEPFDLGREVPLRASAFRVAEDSWTLVLALHHIATDGWSTQRLLDDFTDAYVHSPADLPADPRYAAFARWQQSLVDDTSVAWWVETLRGVDPALVLPAARSRPARPSFAGARRSTTLADDVVRRVRMLAQRERVSPFVVLLSAFAAQLAALTGRAEVVIGTPVANRVLAEHEGVVGPFVNTLPLRLGTGGGGSLALIRRTQGTLVDALEHQHVPLGRIVSALGLERSRSPLVQVLFTGTPPVRLPVRLGDAAVRWDIDPVEGDVAIMDLELAVQDDGEHIGGTLTYATDLFDDAAASDVLDGWIHRLTSARPAARARPA